MLEQATEENMEDSDGSDYEAGRRGGHMLFEPGAEDSEDEEAQHS